jgi:ATP-binding cassette subfamily F protein uup
MLVPADVLILDEPTNDLDIPSLEVLEQSLEEFPGALVLVTHDRFMLDRLATEILGIDGNGNHQLVSDYEQYQNWAGRMGRAAVAEEVSPVKEAVKAEGPKKPRRKLTFSEQKEYDGIEGRILEAEQAVQKYHKEMEDPAAMANRGKLTEVCEKMHGAQEEVAKLYARWEELEGKLNG